MLSRLPLAGKSDHIEEVTICHMQIASLPVSADKIRDQTRRDTVLMSVLKFLKIGQWPKSIASVLQPYYNRRFELSIEGDVILWGLKEVIPKSLQQRILKELHNQHPGIVRMKSLSRIHVWYPKIDADIEHMVKSCENCASVANEPPKSHDHQWSSLSEPMDRIHIDYFDYDSKPYLILVDSFSKWMEGQVMNKTDALSTITTLKHWLTTLGLPPSTS